MKDRIFRKLSEPSTWAGLGILGTIFGVRELEAFAAPEIGAGIAALLAIVLRERGGK